MVDELRTVRWCDLCPKQTPGHNDEATNRWLVAVTDKQREPTLRVLDTCAAHEAPLVALVALLDGTARPWKADTPAGQMRCPLCPTLTRRDTLISHLQHVHGLTKPVQPKRCPDCRKTFPDSPSPNRAMIAHRRQAHDYDLLAAMLNGGTP